MFLLIKNHYNMTAGTNSMYKKILKYGMKLYDKNNAFKN